MCLNDGTLRESNIQGVQLKTINHLKGDLSFIFSHIQIMLSEIRYWPPLSNMADNLILSYRKPILFYDYILHILNIVFSNFLQNLCKLYETKQLRMDLIFVILHPGLN